MTATAHSSRGARAPMATTALDLLDRARASLLEACRAGSVGERYVAALLAARSKPARRSRPRSVWEVLPDVAPELTEWAVFFAASAQRRAAVERDALVVGTREADDLLRQAEIFLGLVQAALGLPLSCPLPELVAPAGRQ